MDTAGRAAVSTETDGGREAVATFVRLDRIGAAAGLVVSIVAAVVVDVLLWWVVAALALLVVLLTAAGRQLADGHLVRPLALAMLGNWITAIAVSVALPFLWPMMALVVVMTVVLAAPHLDISGLAVTLAGATAAIGGVTVIGLRADDAGAIPDIEDDLELVIVVAALSALTIPIGLVVGQANRLQRRALTRATDLNTELRDSQRELAESRRRVVAAGDAARLRIERDLHDGAQQRLVALAMRLRLMQSEVRHGTEADDAALSELVGEVDRSVDELRELAHGIYPPVLEAHGLADAFRAVVRRSASAVSVEIGDIGRHDPTIESAVYFVGLEALANAGKHAPDSTIALRLRRLPEGAIELVVADDGPGFDPAATAGSHGLLGMSDRVGAVDGSVVVASTPGAGTTVTAIVPTG